MFVERYIQPIKRVVARGRKDRRAFIGAHSSRSRPSPLDSSRAGDDVGPSSDPSESTSDGASGRNQTPIADPPAAPDRTRPPRASDRRIKLTYVASTLRRCGPTIRLIHLLQYTDYDKFDVSIVTLSPEKGHNTLIDEIEPFPVKLYSLDSGRISGLLRLKKRFKCSIELAQPDLIHSFGWRSDSCVSKLKHRSAGWIVTSDNIPHMDYPSLFLRFLGRGIARSHVKAMRKCHNLVCCSKFMKSEFEKRYNISGSIVIPTGVEIPRIDTDTKSKERRGDTLQAVTVSSLIPRKNIRYLCEIFKILDGDIAKLVIVGDGREYSNIVRYESDRILLVGHQANVHAYLEDSDFFISASLAEGLPAASLEALSTGLPCLLSDIGPHLELKDEMPPGSVEVFSLSDPPDVVANKLPGYIESILKVSNRKIRKRVMEEYSARKMSQRYQELYSSILRLGKQRRNSKGAEFGQPGDAHNGRLTK